MEVTVAKTAGFCFGVKRAVEKVYEQIEGNPEKLPIYTYGPIIHNEEVVNDLSSRGVTVIQEDDIKDLEKGILIIRSHGVSRRIYELLEERGIQIVDATCPFVKKIHRIVEEESKNGRQIVIIGNRDHPEVEGIRGWSHNKAITVETEQEAQNLDFIPNTKICIVSQTTFNYNKFQYLVEIISKKGYDIIVRNTICDATEKRQSEAKQIAADVDAMIVIGGKNSSNTQKLFEICKEECDNTYYIQTLVDLDQKNFRSIGRVGITAGASTPNNIIEEVHTNVRKF